MQDISALQQLPAAELSAVTPQGCCLPNGWPLGTIFTWFG